MEEKLSRYNKASALRRRARVSAVKRLKLIDAMIPPNENVQTELDVDSDFLQQDHDNTAFGFIEGAESFSDYTCSFNNDIEEVDEASSIKYHSDTSSESSDDDDSDIDLGNRLANWSLKYCVSLTALSALLTILKPYHSTLPKDARTLLKTNTELLVNSRAGGVYFYQGILEALKHTLEKVYNHFPNRHSFNMQLNIDGLPLFKNSVLQFWPILGFIHGIGMKEPIVISLFCGTKKPNSLEDFLVDVIQELNLLKNGFQFRGKTFYLLISSVLCDAPARAYVKGTKSHTGYHGCDKCIQSGEYISHRMTFPESNARLRTDESFKLQTDEDHHTQRSPFVDTYIGMVSQFPHDYMHLVCLGVMRRLLNFWVKGPLQCRLPSYMTEKLSESLLGIRSYIPTEFARKPRSLSELAHWKATEFRQFLLYTGPVVLRDILNQILYRNFMLFCVGIYILCSPELCERYHAYAHDVLVLFTQHFAQLFGEEYLVYNVHGLVHLTKDAVVHGNLDKFSCFVFENYLGKLKRLVRKPNLPLEQVIRRISEYNAVQTDSADLLKINVVCKKGHRNGPIPKDVTNSEVDSQYKEVFLEDLCVKVARGDNCVSVGKTVGLVRNIFKSSGNTYIVLEEFKSQTSFFDYPLESIKIGIFRLKYLSGTMKYFPVENIDKKYVLLPFQDHFVGIPFLHHKS